MILLHVNLNLKLSFQSKLLYMLPRFDNPHEAVFIGKFGRGGRPLFKNQSELADQINKCREGGFHDKSITTIRSALSQIFTGERNLSKNLKHVLFLVIRNHFDLKKYDFVEFEKILLEKFREVYAERMKNKKDRSPDIDYDNLITATEKGEEFLITTLEPAELNRSEQAERLKNQLLEKTGIVPQASDETIIPARYKFYFPLKDGERIAREFWEELRRNAIVEYNQDSGIVDSKLAEANSNGTILTYLAPSNIAIHPYVFIDYTKKNKVSGFCVSYKNRQVPSVAELSLKFIFDWFEEYEPVIKKLEDETDETKPRIFNYRFEPK